MEWKNSNIYFLVYIQKAGTDSNGQEYSNSYTINKFSFKKEKNVIKVNNLKKVEDRSMYNVKVISATIVDIYDILAVAYLKETTAKLTLKFYNSTLNEINACDVDAILNPGQGLFLKLILCRDDYIAIIFFQNGKDEVSIKVKFYKINFQSYFKTYYLEQTDAHYSFGTNLKQFITLSDFYKINENRFIFVSTIEYTKLFIYIIETYDSYKRHKYKEYTFNLQNPTNNLFFTKELSLGMYKGFILFTSTISNKINSVDNYLSYLIFFGYANGTDFTTDISPYFADIEGYNSNNDFVTFLLGHSSVDNNIFSYNLIRKVKF